MAMQCPSCGSTHIQPMAVVHAGGTQQFHATHTAVTSDGQFVQGSSQGSQSTALAQHCAPPAPPSPMPFIIALGLGGAIVYHAHGVRPFERGCRVGMSFLALLIYNWKQAAVGIGLIALGWLLMKGWHAQAKATVPRSASGSARGFAIRVGRHTSGDDGSNRLR
jgi:hypothetical protein